MATADQGSAKLPVDDVFTFGQVLVRPISGGRFRLSHRDDTEGAVISQLFQNPDDALELARTDDHDNYRPLKTAPNLRRGWQLELTGIEDLKRALEFFYPGRLAVLAALQTDRLSSTPLRHTLARQSGMYRIAANISEEQLDHLIGDFCRSDGRCLRTILWKRDAAGTVPSTRLPPQKYDEQYDQALTNGAIVRGSAEVPLLCQEACNLLVAECRTVVKGETD
jgi:hypothetical protein